MLRTLKAFSGKHSRNAATAVSKACCLKLNVSYPPEYGKNLPIVVRVHSGKGLLMDALRLAVIEESRREQRELRARLAALDAKLAAVDTP